MEMKNSNQSGDGKEGELLPKPVRIIVPEINPIITEISKAVKQLIDGFIEYTNDIKEIDRKQYSGYFDWLSESVAACESKVDALHFLMKEKANCEDKIIRAKIESDVITEKDYEKVIRQFIEPLIRRYKEWIVFEKEHPISVATENGQLGVIETSKEKVELIRIAEVNDSVVQNESVILSLPKGFAKISCDASKEQISNFFSILTKVNNPINGKPYLNQDCVNELVKNNFEIFLNTTPTGKCFELNLMEHQKGVLRYFIYEFYTKYEISQIGTKMKYVNFLIWNFSLFKNDNPKNLNKNMNSSNKPSPDKIIPIDKYLKM